jgi:uncharacterized protein YacL
MKRLLLAAFAVALPPASIAAWALVRLFEPWLGEAFWPRAVIFGGAWLLVAAGLLTIIRTLVRRLGGKPHPPYDPHAPGSHSRPLLLDTSVIIDGRIADLVETRLFDGELVVPQFVVAELQGVADSSDKLRRARGRRGLDVLNRLKQSQAIHLQFDDRELREYADQPVDRKLVLLAKDIGAKVVTNDFNLNKVAKLAGIEVVNLNDISTAVRPVCLPGEQLTIEIVKPGEQAQQGVGYLDDGTMVVVEGAREQVGKRAKLTVTSVTQSSAGRMIFGKLDSVEV